MKNIALILFDIGNVLVKLTGASIIINNSKKHLSKEYVWDTWTSIKCVTDFETGATDSSSFSKQVIDFYDLTLDPDQFINLFYSAAESKFEGVDYFLQHLSKQYDLACLTNTNPIQWPKIKNEFGLGSFFTKQYVSYEIGFMKPKAEIFKYVLNDTGLNPRSILFIDDNFSNIKAAEHQGFHCCHVNDFEDARIKIMKILSVNTQGGNVLECTDPV